MSARAATWRARAARVLMLTATIAIACRARAAEAAPRRPSFVPAIVSAPVSEEPDTSLGGFLHGLSDSTDVYFGKSSAPPDTAGLDSALDYGLDHPEEERGRAFARSIGPAFDFNRVDGAVLGGVAGIGSPARFGKLEGRARYAFGPDRWLGGGAYQLQRRKRDAVWTLELAGERSTATMNRDTHERGLSMLRAVISGKDRQHYLRRDGVDASLERVTPLWRAAIGYRDMLESPLAVTTTWNLLKKPLAVPFNLAATPGRAHEARLEAAWRIPKLPVIAEIAHQTSGHAIGSDFEYRRTRAAMSGNFGWGPISIVPQAEYGRVDGTPTPQSSFYIGGAHTLRSLTRDARGGTGIAVARLDLIEAPDLLKLAHVPHPAMFPLQAGLFAGIGAVWGADPYGGPTVPGADWPHRESWMSEVGASLIYQPGIPDPTSLVRFNFARALGPAREHIRFSISYSRALDLVKPLGEDN
jgi:hypothetical protein